MNIALVNPRPVGKSFLGIPHGLLQIGAELSANGHSFEIFDANDEETRLDIDRLGKFDVVGLSVNSLQLNHAVEIAGALKNSVKIVWGGIHCLLDPASILNAFPEHCVVKGEGEKPLLDILKHFEGGESAEWLASRDGVCMTHEGSPSINKAYFVDDLNALNDIDYYRLPRLEKYISRDFYYVTNKVRHLGILTSRGCHWNCSFCINSLLARNGAHYRSKSMEKIIREVDKVIDDFGIKFLNPTDEDFFLNKEILPGWLDYVRSKGLFWGANCRYNYFVDKIINERKLEEYVKSGLFAVGMSIEAGDESIRNSILNKHVNDSHIHNTIKTIRNTVGDRLAVNTSFIVDFPGDTRDSQIKMLRIMDELSRNLNITFSGPQAYRPYPGSELYNKGTKFKEGDLQYYLKGSFNGGLSNEAAFYSRIARVYYNTKCKFFRFSCKKDGACSLEIDEKRGKRNGWKRSILIKIVKVAFSTTLLRLRFDYWGFYHEPYLLGFLTKLFQ